MKKFTLLNKFSVLVVTVLLISTNVAAQTPPPGFGDNVQDVPIGSGFLALGLIVGAIMGIRKMK